MMAFKCKTSNEIWTKLEETFGGSTSLGIDHLPKELLLTSNNEELQIASTSDCVDDPMPSISPTCDMTGGNDLVSTEMTCDSGNAIYTDDSSSIVYNDVDTLDLNTSCNKFFTHSCVKGSCIPPRICLIKSCDAMLSSCGDHDQDACISPSCDMANHVGKIKENLGHIINEEISRRVNKKKSKKRTCYECHEYEHFGKECPTLHNEAHLSSRGTSSSPDSHICLMARESKVSPTLTTNTSSNDDDNDDDNDNDNENNNLLCEMGLVYASLFGNKEARASLEHSMETMNGYKETIRELESYIENSRMRFNPQARAKR
jgi:hypothetical protein